MITYILLFLAGIVGGALAGITGVGTGFIMITVIPIALHHMGIPEDLIVRFTIANTIFATMCSSLMNNIQLIIKKQIYLKETVYLAIVAGTIAILLLQLVVHRPGYTTDIYNMIIIILMIYIIIRTVTKLRKSFTPSEEITVDKLIVTGTSGGAMAALTGLGGGSMIIPMLNLWMKVGIRKAKTISYGTIFIISLVLTVTNIINKPEVDISYSHFGYLIFSVALPLAGGAILGSPIGLKLSEYLSAKFISYAFLTIISLVTLRKVVELVI